MRQYGLRVLTGRLVHPASLLIAVGLVLAACTPAASPSPTAAPAAKPTEASAAKSTEASAAKPAAPVAAPAAPAAGSGEAKPAPATSPAAAAPAKPVQRVTLKSAYTTTSATMAMAIAALEGGFFAEEGLDVSLTRIQAGTPMLSAMRGGDVPIAFMGAQQIVEADLQGADFVILAAFMEQLGQQIYVIPSIQSPDDLKGKAIGVSSFGAVTHVAGQLGVEKLGIKDQVTFLATGGPPETIAAMQGGKVQGGVFSPPDSFRAREMGMRELLDVASTGAKSVTSSIGTTKKWLSENPDVAERYVRASIKATHRMKTDKEFGMMVIGKHSGLEDPRLLEETYLYYRDQYLADPIPSEAGLQQALDLAAAEIPEAKNAKPAQFVDLTILNKLKTAGLIDQLYKR